MKMPFQILYFPEHAETASNNPRKIIHNYYTIPVPGSTQLGTSGAFIKNLRRKLLDKCPEI